VTTIAVSQHPRAVRGVRRTRAAAGLAGFLVGAWLAHGAGLPAFDVLLRALLAGIGTHVAGWFFAVAYWRTAILAELEAARRRRDAAHEAADRLLRDTADAATHAA
jgi:hypothetical protein